MRVVRLFGLSAETDQGVYRFPAFDVNATFIRGDTLRMDISLCFVGERLIVVDHRDNDNAMQELLELAKAGDRLGFSAVAGCLMPKEEVDECWAGTRTRLGLVP